jgi:hypothetical protein
MAKTAQRLVIDRPASEPANPTLECGVGFCTADDLCNHEPVDDNSVFRAGCGRAPDSVSKVPTGDQQWNLRFTSTTLDVGGPCFEAFG